MSSRINTWLQRLSFFSVPITVSVIIELRDRELLARNSERSVLVPLVVAENYREKEVVAIGQNALRMVGKTTGYIECFYPFELGKVVYPELMASLLKEALRMLNDGGLVSFFARPSVTIIAQLQQSGLQEEIWRRIAQQAGVVQLSFISRADALRDWFQGISKIHQNIILELDSLSTHLYWWQKTDEHVSWVRVGEGTEGIQAFFSNWCRVEHSVDVPEQEITKIITQLAEHDEAQDEFRFTLKAKSLATGLPTTLKIKAKDLYIVATRWAENVTQGVIEALEGLSVEETTLLLDQGLTVMGDVWYSSILERALTKTLKAPVIRMSRPDSLIEKSFFADRKTDRKKEREAVK